MPGALIDVVVPERIVQIPIERTTIRGVVPITADEGGNERTTRAKARI
jgi:hypothetical protein